MVLFNVRKEVSMLQKHKKLKLNIKGRHQRFWTSLVLITRIKALGVNVHKVKHEKNHSHIELSGEEKKLWKAIEMSKKPFFFVELDQVAFEFSEAY